VTERSGSPDRLGNAETTLHVRGAVGGDPNSLEWIVTHFTPFLLAQAHYRIGRRLQGLYDPEDLVQRTWAIALGRLGSIIPQSDRYTPVLMRFLSAILLQDYRNLLKKHAGKRRDLQSEDFTDSLKDPMAQVPAHMTAISTKAVRGERTAELWAAVRGLEEKDREILVMHGIEQLPFNEIATRLGPAGPAVGTLRWRYHEALKRLKERFPAQMIEELEAEAGD
jgi:RNA polymerase sigma factor (sigma-70 family)